MLDNYIFRAFIKSNFFGEKILENLFKFDRAISQNVLNFILEI